MPLGLPNLLHYLKLRLAHIQWIAYIPPTLPALLSSRRNQPLERDMIDHIDAQQVLDQLAAAVAALRKAEGKAVALFADVLRRKLYRHLGYSSIHLYAEQVLDFSRTKTYEFIRLAEALDELPGLKAGIESGELPWTKAREVVKVATPATENQWLELAAGKSRRELEKEVVKSRAKRNHRRKSPGQSELLKPDHKSPPEAAPTQTVSLRMEPMTKARFEAMVEKLMKKHHCDREQVLMMALESLTHESPRGDGASPYQVIVQHCPDCGSKTVGPERHALSATESARIDCDSKMLEPGKRNRQSIPPARRRAVLIRDGHRCRVEGCGSSRFLELHHLKPRNKGGDNSEVNLITLCSGCHRLHHERGLKADSAPAPAPPCPPRANDVPRSAASHRCEIPPPE